MRRTTIWWIAGVAFLTLMITRAAGLWIVPGTASLVTRSTPTVDPFWGGAERPPWAKQVLRLAEQGAPIDEQRAALERTLEAQGLSDVAIARVMAHTVNGIELLDDRGTDHATVVGGRAMLMDGAEWPRNPKSGGRLSFLGRIDLAEVHASEPLPTSGSLLVYWDEADTSLDPWTTVHVDYAPPGREIHTVDDLPAGAPRYLETPQRAVAEPITGEFDDIVAGLPQAEQDHMYDVLGELSWGMSNNQLLGASRDVQGPVLDEVSYWFNETASAETRSHFTAGERAGAGWMLLAQFTGIPPDAQGRGSMMFADGGNLSLLIQHADLAARRFDRVIGIIQSH